MLFKHNESEDKLELVLFDINYYIKYNQTPSNYLTTIDGVKYYGGATCNYLLNPRTLANVFKTKFPGQTTVGFHELRNYYISIYQRFCRSTFSNYLISDYTEVLGFNSWKDVFELRVIDEGFREITYHLSSNKFILSVFSIDTALQDYFQPDRNGNPYSLPTHQKNYTWRPFSFPRLFMKNDNHNATVFGVEVEVNSDLTATDLANLCMNEEPKQDLFFYCKSDISITGRFSCSYEIVTLPMSLKRHQYEWKVLLQKLSDAGVSFDNDTTTNGIHVHMDNGAFLKANDKSIHRKRFHYLFSSVDDEGFVDLRRKVSKRSPTAYCKLNTKSLRDLYKESRYTHSDHYCAVNDTAYTTEVRVFKSVMDYQHILGCIEMVDAMRVFSLEVQVARLKRETYRSFINWLLKRKHKSKYENLIGEIQCA